MPDVNSKGSFAELTVASAVIAFGKDGDDLTILIGAPWVMDVLTLVYLVVRIFVSRLTYQFVEDPADAVEPGALKQAQPAAYRKYQPRIRFSN